VDGIRRLEATHARTAEVRLEPQPQRVTVAGHARYVQASWDNLGLNDVGFASERERFEAHADVDPSALTRGETQTCKVEAVDRCRHLLELSDSFQVGCHDSAVSRWFRTYGYAGVYDHLIVGAVPLDSSDVDRLAALHVSRVLNLVDDAEYKRGERRKVERALSGAAIEEQRLPTEDYGNLGPDALDDATAQVNAWLDEGQVVYLHCRAGWQRSAAVAAATIALRDGIEIDAALQRVQALKANADPLPHQREDLHAWWESRRAATRPLAGGE
jgi:predicted protein tyrosine phosphatase